ncbi:MAG TPA: hypothetical protein VKX16_10575, partial [Chloroflexota bacterium]|nr:hypothetical protein [Chloroflexota bacterium]
PGAAGNYLRSNGTSWSSSPIQASDLPPGSNNYIQNTTTQQASANFNIAGNGTVGGILSAGKSATIAPSGGSGTLLQVGTAGTSFGSYVQIPLVQASGAPPASDCNTTSFVGRMVQVYTGKALTLYGCAPTGKWAIEK